MFREIQIEIAPDVVCRWCSIGKRRLEKALALLDSQVKAHIVWLPFQLNPGIPDEGMPRAAYRKQKLGPIEARSPSTASSARRTPARRTN